MISNTGNIGRYASKELRQDGEWLVGQILPGIRYDCIEVRLTRADYMDTNVQIWLHQHLFQCVNRAGKTPVNITVFT